MDNGVQLAPQDFIKSLTGASPAEIQTYAAEIMSDREFNNRLGESRSNPRRRRFSSWGKAIGTGLGTVLYIVCRALKPDTVVETGVASGMSSSYILSSLEKNKHGELYSIDLPWEGTMTYPRRNLDTDGLLRETTRERQSGWLIPDSLRHRWHLIMGRSSETLLPLLDKLGGIDIFLHDSEHSYQNMLWEYETAWAHLKTGRILLSHNIDMNNAFSHFCRKVGAKGFVLANMGGIVKA